MLPEKIYMTMTNRHLSLTEEIENVVDPSKVASLIVQLYNFTLLNVQEPPHVFHNILFCCSFIIPRSKTSFGTDQS